jgi:putative ABC transport system permease protein
MDGWIEDFRHAIRLLFKRPGFAATVITALALCIGANTAMFSVTDKVLLHGLPYPHAERLISVSEEMTGLMSGPIPFSPPDYEELLRRDQLFQRAGLYSGKQLELSGASRPEMLEGARISASLFPTLGIGPALGRNFTEEEDRNGKRVAILSDSLWRSKFGSDQSVLGRQILLGRVPYTVVGVMPSNIVFPLRGPKFNNDPASIYIPVSFSKDELTDWGNRFNYSVIARLKPAVALAEAKSELAALAPRIAAMYPAEDKPFMKGFSLSAVSLHDEVVGDIRPMLLLLFAAVALVLLIGCADVAGLLLTRATGRQREMSIRVAIGATRAQLMRQVLIESATLAVLGGAVGLLLCAWLGGILARLASNNMPAANGIQINGTTLLFTLGLSLLTAVIVGVAPAARASQTQISQGMRESGRGTSVGRSHGQILDALVVGQFAFALLLLVGAGLLVRSFSHILTTSPGFRPDHILRMQVSLPAEAYGKAGSIRTFFNTLDAALPLMPGVKATGLATSLPLAINEHRSFFVFGEAHGGKMIPHSTAHIWVMGDFFQAMGVPLLKGRSLTDEDVPKSLPVVVVSEALARRMWPGRNPIGQQISWGGSKDPWMTVVGVAVDVKEDALNQPSGFETYSPWRQVNDDELADVISNEFRDMTIVVRTANTPTSEAPAIVRLIHRLDPSLPVTKVTTMEAELQDSVRAERFQTTLLGGFTVAALVLAALGIGGVLAYSVAQRVSEIGIRMALGASRWRVISMVLRHGMKLAGIGTAIGLVSALLLTRLMTHLLYEISPYDALTFCIAPIFLCTVALIAILLPARRAAGVDATQALRSE